MRILVVDDDRFLGEYLVRALNENGHEARHLDSAVKALAAANESDFDLLMCDLVMPGLNGIHAVRSIRQRQPNLPIIVLSSLPPSKWEAKVKEAGAACYLHKPITIDDLLREVRLVEASRVRLNVGIIDFDPQHRARITNDLEGLGCRVRAWSTLPDMLREPTVTAGLSLLLVDTESRDAITALGWAKEYRIPTVAFGEAAMRDQEYMLRLGASLCVDKPVDAPGLLTQARFLHS
jgi:DNA-binding response OmpR family regulator